MKEFDPKFLKISLMVATMVASTVVFAFSTFEGKGDAERKYNDQAKNLSDVNQRMDTIHQDLRDSIHEIDAKLDILLQSRK